jgi:hypothetical protein
VQHNAEEVSAFQQLGTGVICYVCALDHVDVAALCGREMSPHEIAFALIDSDGSPILLRGSAAACLIEASERGLVVAWVH